MHFNLEVLDSQVQNCALTQHHAKPPAAVAVTSGASQHKPYRPVEQNTVLLNHQTAAATLFHKNCQTTMRHVHRDSNSKQSSETARLNVILTDDAGKSHSIDVHQQLHDNPHDTAAHTLFLQVQEH